ncbi:hypothetical protein CDAR_238511 [Caerostris darwini]|uniref:Uncharacterized protein n=1 Tax=Caerostris darwini TaxID=1538125 RepID=A0AAV4W458_9ARAC|nr:hypothetical protein CDAR_238511 [Caerostris darwini]
MPEYHPLSVTQITLTSCQQKVYYESLFGKWHLLVDYLFNKPLPRDGKRVFCSKDPAKEMMPHLIPKTLFANSHGRESFVVLSFYLPPQRRIYVLDVKTGLTLM